LLLDKTDPIRKNIVNLKLYRRLESLAQPSACAYQLYQLGHESAG
jgi:hypothetical protein